MHRLIVTSATYRQSSRSDPEARKRDAGDRLLWRKAPVRLEAEMVRDAMLAVSGRLNPTLGGPSFRDHDLVKAPGTPADPLRRGRSLEARLRPPHPLPRLGPGGPEHVPRRLRLPGPVDHRAAAGRHDHPAAGPGDDEQRTRPPSERRLRRSTETGGGGRARGPGGSGLPTRVWPEARTRRAGSRRPGRRAVRRLDSRGPSSIATNSCTSTDGRRVSRRATQGGPQSYAEKKKTGRAALDLQR